MPHQFGQFKLEREEERPNKETGKIERVLIKFRIKDSAVCTGEETEEEETEYEVS